MERCSDPPQPRRPVARARSAPPPSRCWGCRSALDGLTTARSDWIDATVAAGGTRLRLRRRDAHGDGRRTTTRAARGRPRRRLHGPGRPAARVGAQRCSATGCRDRVYGPDLMDRACARAARTGSALLPLRRPQPGRAGGARALCCASATRTCRSSAATRPPYRELTPSGGGRSGGGRHRAQPAPTSCGWASASPSRRSGWRACATAARRRRVLIGVGAAFDFHAGLVPQAPGWMQRVGLEWAFRLAQEPRRLWRRYLRYNPRFVAGFARQWARERLGLRRVAPAWLRVARPSMRPPPRRVLCSRALVGA